MKNRIIVKPPQSKSLKSSRVILAPGEDVGEHVTDNREELIIILRGSGALVKSGKRIAISEGDTHFIPQGTKHNIINDSKAALEYVYVVALFQ